MSASFQQATSVPNLYVHCAALPLGSVPSAWRTASCLSNAHMLSAATLVGMFGPPCTPTLSARAALSPKLRAAPSVQRRSEGLAFRQDQERACRPLPAQRARQCSVNEPHCLIAPTPCPAPFASGQALAPQAWQPVHRGSERNRPGRGCHRAARRHSPRRRSAALRAARLACACTSSALDAADPLRSLATSRGLAHRPRHHAPSSSGLHRAHASIARRSASR